METPSEPKDKKPSSSKHVYQVQTTGSFWGDVREAVNVFDSLLHYTLVADGFAFVFGIRKNISIVDDFLKIGEIPCARGSLLNGIASGFGIGVIRGMSTPIMVASNWAVGTFVVISLGSWTICRNNMENERRRVQQVVEQMPKRFVKGDAEPNTTDSS
ncbi:hypothetical protein EIP91_004007 [Steccherinum ochraceum]|uniref:Cytochrome c oxidase assembly protein COX20, mitochondrial n=1 Tax=Steccherinum ochraceum TaxID=92696 RepID=A0A4R0R9K7_9APHY|nr:hypothetical protein EIP91_004007 [Steccherinum ochraceum]